MEFSMSWNIGKKYKIFHYIEMEYIYYTVIYIVVEYWEKIQNIPLH